MSFLLVTAISNCYTKCKLSAENEFTTESYVLYQTLISTSTPLGNSNFIKASTVLAVEL